MKNCIALLIVLGLSLPAFAQGAKEPNECVAVTVYSSRDGYGGIGVVREVRTLDIDAKGVVQFKDVAAQIDPTTVHFRSITDPQARLLEQNYQFDLVSADKLLTKYVDKTIDVVCKDNKTYSGQLLSFDGSQIVVKEKDSITMIQRADNVRDIRFKDLPGGLLTRPTLVWQVATAKGGRQLAEVTYQTGGVNWHAEYVLVLNAADTAADLSGWVSFQNNSGKTYTDAKLKFVAGDVHRVEVSRRGYADLEGGFAGKGAPSAPAMVEQGFFEYHMYTLQRPSTVADNEVKQLELFDPAHDVKIVKKYLYDPLFNYRWYRSGPPNKTPSYDVTSPRKVQVFVEFKNEKANNLGIPLPGGKVRCFKQDPNDKALEFIGEEKIDHTPTDEKLSLQIGNAFDVVGEWKQVDLKVNEAGHTMKEIFEIKLRNHKEEDVVVRVRQPMHRAKNWNITDEPPDFKHVKLDASTIAFDVTVKAKKETVFTYTVEYTW
jgi:hypothetical protein